MSDEGGGSFGPFLLGVVIGAGGGGVFAPNAGEVTRKQVRRKLRGLREMAEEKADEISALMAGEDTDEDAESETPADEPSAREELEQRLAEARRRRRQAKRGRELEEEDHPVA